MPFKLMFQGMITTANAWQLPPPMAFLRWHCCNLRISWEMLGDAWGAVRMQSVPVEEMVSQYTQWLSNCSIDSYTLKRLANHKALPALPIKKQYEAKQKSIKAMKMWLQTENPEVVRIWSADQRKMLAEYWPQILRVWARKIHWFSKVAAPSCCFACCLGSWQMSGSALTCDRIIQTYKECE